MGFDAKGNVVVLHYYGIIAAQKKTHGLSIEKHEFDDLHTTPSRQRCTKIICCPIEKLHPIISLPDKLAMELK